MNLHQESDSNLKYRLSKSRLYIDTFLSFVDWLTDQMVKKKWYAK